MKSGDAPKGTRGTLPDLAGREFYRLGDAPADLPAAERKRLRLVTMPQWTRGYGTSGLGWLFEAERDLKENGLVVPGALVQANDHMYAPDGDDMPGEVVFTFAAEPDLRDLSTMAGEVFRLKGRRCREPDESFVADYLADEMTRVRGIPVPARLDTVGDSFISTTVFFRDALPKRCLRGSVYPFLVSTETMNAVVLPSKLWSESGWEIYGFFAR
jgi:hypothetical protein